MISGGIKIRDGEQTKKEHHNLAGTGFNGA